MANIIHRIAHREKPKQHPRQILARRRNMFIGRFRGLEGMLTTLRQQLLSDIKDAGYSLPALEQRFSWAQNELAQARQLCEAYYAEHHNIKTPQPTTPTESEK